MQLLFKSSNEFGFYKGLNLIEGKVEKISDQTKRKIKVPHIGWNTISFYKKNKLSDNNINSFYFIHSFMVKTKKENILAYTKFEGINIPAIVKKKNIIGFQFHPEKSAISGLSLIKEFCEYD